MVEKKSKLPLLASQEISSFIWCNQRDGVWVVGKSCENPFELNNCGFH